MSSESSTNTVDAYDVNLTRTTPTPLSAARSNLAAATVGGYALFGGGENGGDVYPTVDAYGTNLIRSTTTGLSAARTNLAATAVGGYALFGGGSHGSSYSSAVDAYYLNDQVQVYPGTKYKLGSMTDESTSDSMQMKQLQRL